MPDEISEPARGIIDQILLGTEQLFFALSSPTLAETRQRVAEVFDPAVPRVGIVNRFVDAVSTQTARVRSVYRDFISRLGIGLVLGSVLAVGLGIVAVIFIARALGIKSVPEAARFARGLS